MELHLHALALLIAAVLATVTATYDDYDTETLKAVDWDTKEPNLFDDSELGSGAFGPDAVEVFPTILPTNTPDANKINCDGVSEKFECLPFNGPGFSSVCVPAVYRCDGLPDCPLGDDEASCDQLTCPEGFFRCDEGTCVAPSKRGGYMKFCKEGEDAVSGTVACPRPFFRCNAEKCMLPGVRCDGIKDCPQGEDEVGCVGRPCGRGQFNCGDGLCLPSSVRCDGRQDCPAGADELDCFIPKCPPDEFDCGERCIAVTLLCNGVDDCGTGVDEVNCPHGCNQRDEFTCGDGTCVWGKQRCDGREDCADSTDEADCTKSCDKDQFSCGYRCVPLGRRCDGVPDCVNAWDEEHCDPTCEMERAMNMSSSCGIPPLCKDNPDFCRLNKAPYLEPAKRVCPAGQFACDGLCADAALRCDGVQHCIDNADEESCPSQPCMPGEFLCDDGRCRNVTLRCDGTPHCPDGSDEEHCECDEGELACGPVGECVSRTRVCDGLKDCANGLDEVDCHVSTGPFCEDSFPCDGNRCIDDSKVCDRVRDCADGADELGHMCIDYCEEGKILCLGRCVPVAALCDGVHDCPDRLDESEAVCGSRARRSSRASNGLGATKSDLDVAIYRLQVLQDMMPRLRRIVDVVIQSMAGGIHSAPGQARKPSPFDFLPGNRKNEKWMKKNNDE